jgi:hypothetical protein
MEQRQRRDGIGCHHPGRAPELCASGWYAVAPAAIIGGFHLRPCVACTDGVIRSARITRRRIAAMRTRPAQLGISAGRPLTGGGSRCRPTARPAAGCVPPHSGPPRNRGNAGATGGGRPFRAVRRLSRVICVRNKTRPEAVRMASAMSTRPAQRQTEVLTSRLTGDRFTQPTPERKPGAGGRVLPRGDTAHRAEGPSAAHAAAERGAAAWRVAGR